MELNGYRIMWLFVFFDLPTDTAKDRKNAAGFRKNLLKDDKYDAILRIYAPLC
jgi:CRISPR-associated protein Cas2